MNYQGQNESYQPVNQGYPNQYVMQAPVMKVTDWLLTMLLMSIPIVNIVLMIVWAVDKNGNPNRTNYVRAALIMFAIGLVLYVVLIGLIFGLAGGLLDNF